MTVEIVGRDEEFRSIEAFLERASEGPAALVLEGAAGIGKSTLWLRGLELARERGLRVLASRPAEAERDLALTGLGDLFEGCLEDVLPALPPPRRRALEVALLLEEAQDPLAPRALAVAVRSALELLAEAQSLVCKRLDRVFLRPTLLRIHETSGGNPFYALEIARALPHELEPTRRLPVPETLEKLVRTRIAALPERSRQALVLLSAMAEGDTDTLRKAGAEDALEAAVSQGIVARAVDRLRFTHPLLASSVYQEADEAARRSCHAVLAEIVRDPLERARHLALAAEGPDAEIAASLDHAAAVASVRGVPNVAAELGELARRLTPDDDRDGRHRRAILGATAHLRAGDVRRARSLAEETLA